LAECYALFANEFGFVPTPVRTDYRFASVAEATELTEFFFGMALTGTAQPDGTAIVPEWTGAFVRRV
jgi:hypothetical protein